MRRRHFRSPLLPIAALSLAAAACSTGIDSAVFMSAPPLPAGEQVRIYRTQMPDCPYDELGLVTWQPTSGWQKLQTGVDRMRARAREMGGHAIVGFGMSEQVGGTSTTISSDSTSVTVGSSVNTRTMVSGTVVRFREDGCTR